MNSYIQNQFNKVIDDNIDLYALKIMSDKDSTHWISIKKDDLEKIKNILMASEKLEMENEVSIDANGYYFGDNLTPAQEMHNLNLDNQL